MISTFGKVRFGATANGVEPLSTGIPPAMYPGAIATNAQLSVAVDRLQTRLAVPLAATDNVMQVQSGAGIVASCLLTIDNEIVQVLSGSGTSWTIRRGFDGTTPALHLGSSIVSGFIDAWHHNALVSEVQALETFLGPNGNNLPTTAVRTPIPFSAQAPGGNLIIGANVISLSPVPRGVNGTDQNHYLYISGGTGTPEAALITGGSAVAGAPTGQLIITCANTHSGAWTIQSATAGIQEAIVDSPSGSRVLIPGGSYTLYGKISLGKTMSLRGQGAQVTSLNMATGFVTRAMEVIAPSGGYATDLGDFTIFYSTPGTTGEGLYMQEVTDGIVSNLTIINSFDGVTGYGVGRVHFIAVNQFPQRNGYNFSSNPSSSIITVSVPTILGGFISMASASAGAVIYLGPTIAGLDIIGLNSALGSIGIAATASSGAINEVNMVGCIIDSTGAFGVLLQLTGTATASRWNIAHNKFAGSGSNGVANGLGGIHATTTSAGNIMGFVAEGNTILMNNSTTDGFTLSGVSGGMITNNQVGNNVAGGNGMLMDTVANTDFVIAGNTFGLGAAFNSTNPASFGIYINSQAHTRISITGNRLIGSIAGLSNNSTVAGGVVAIGNVGAPDSTVADTGANNAIAGALVGVPLAAGTRVAVVLAHSLQAGANTFNFNGGGAAAIKSARNPSNDIAAAWAAGGTITLFFDGARWLDVSQ